jgi:hypothetical protein
LHSTFLNTIIVLIYLFKLKTDFDETDLPVHNLSSIPAFRFQPFDGSEY